MRGGGMAMNHRGANDETGNQVVSNDMSGCCKMSIVGGLNSAPALLEYANAHHASKAVLHNALSSTLVPAADLQYLSNSFSFLVQSGRFSPTARERYVLNSALLL